MAEYTIKIPGLDQIIRLGVNNPNPMSAQEKQSRLDLTYWKQLTGEERTEKQESYLSYLNYKYDTEYLPQLEREKMRIQRMKEKPSPVPEPLRWIPGVINFLDDAQDLMFTAAYLARPLLKRIPLRFIPYVGWGLIAMDLINLTNAIMGFSMVPCVSKPDFRKNMNYFRTAPLSPYTAFEEFMRKGGWRNRFAFLIQGAQALNTIFDRGLVLGPILGAMSEASWAVMRSFTSEDVKIKWKLPPPSDIIGKAGRFLSQTYQHVMGYDILDPADHFLLLAAQKISGDLICEQGEVVIDDRMEQFLKLKAPVIQPWTEPAKEALAAEGIAVDENTTYYFLDPAKDWTYGDLFDAAIPETENWSQGMRRLEVGYDELSVWYQTFREMAEDHMFCVTGVHPDDYQDYSQTQKVAMRYVESPYMILPRGNISETTQFYNQAIKEAQAEGKDLPDYTHFKKAASWNRYAGGSKNPYCVDPDNVCVVLVYVMSDTDLYNFLNASVELFQYDIQTITLTPELYPGPPEELPKRLVMEWADGWGAGSVGYTNWFGCCCLWALPKGTYEMHINHCGLKNPFVQQVGFTRRYYELTFHRGLHTISFDKLSLAQTYYFAKILPWIWTITGCK